jgi:hypothetical protein
MAGSTGLEPAASAVTGQRSSQLNYDPKFERFSATRFRASPIACLHRRRPPSLPLTRELRRAKAWAVQDSNL